MKVRLSVVRIALGVRGGRQEMSTITQLIIILTLTCVVDRYGARSGSLFVLVVRKEMKRNPPPPLLLLPAFHIKESFLPGKL